MCLSGLWMHWQGLITLNSFSWDPLSLTPVLIGPSKLRRTCLQPCLLDGPWTYIAALSSAACDWTPLALPGAVSGPCDHCQALLTVSVGSCPDWRGHGLCWSHTLRSFLFVHGAALFLLLPENIKPVSAQTFWLIDTEFSDFCIFSPLWYRCIFCPKKIKIKHIYSFFYASINSLYSRYKDSVYSVM